MLTKDNKINWIETLASIADDKGESLLSAHIRSFVPVKQSSALDVVTPVDAGIATPVDYSGLSSHFAKPSNFNITKMPEATCDGCQ